MLKPSAEVVVLPSGMTSEVAEAMVTAVRYPPRHQHLHCDESATQLGLHDIGRINSTPPAAPTPSIRIVAVWSPPRGKLLAVIVLAAREHALPTAT